MRAASNGVIGTSVRFISISLMLFLPFTGGVQIRALHWKLILPLAAYIKISRYYLYIALFDDKSRDDLMLRHIKA
jgi:hypothetical protein